MKAYQAWDTRSVEECSTVVFAETAQEAKVIAFHTETCEDADFINVRVRRLPQMDGRDRGRSEVDWYDMDDRKALVAIGWACLETSWDCDTCPCKSICSHWEGEEETTQQQTGIVEASVVAALAVLFPLLLHAVGGCLDARGDALLDGDVHDTRPNNGDLTGHNL